MKSLALADCRELISELALQLETQDNRATETPIYVVQEEHVVHGLEGEFCEEQGWFSGSQVVTATSRPDLWARLEAGEACEEDSDDSPWHKTGFRREWRHVQSFFTLSAATLFSADEAHNLGKTRIYVDSGHRNYEWQIIRQLLQALAGAPQLKLPSMRFYTVRAHHTWARIWVTDDGSVAILSDYGNYAYWWTHTGCEIRQFLVKADADYIEDKLSYGLKKEYDPEATLKNIKGQILRLRRAKRFTRDQVLDELELLKRHNDLYDERDLILWYEDTQLVGITDISVAYQRPSQLRHFMKVLWPVFVEMLKTELEQERAAAPQVAPAEQAAGAAP